MTFIVNIFVVRKVMLMGIFDIFKINQFKSEIEMLKAQNAELNQKLNNLGYETYEQVRTATEDLQRKYEAQQQQFNNTLTSNEATIKRLQEEITRLANDRNNLNEQIRADKDKSDKQLKATTNKIARSKELYKSVEYAINTFFNYEPTLDSIKLIPSQQAELEELSPSVILKLSHMDVKSLNKEFRENNKQIEKILKQYQSRYTTKANKAIYDLMVIALRAELQNILYNLKYDKLSNAVKQVQDTTKKYLDIAANGNQSIAGTLTKFIGEIEYLFINAVKIEYNYYVKKEQARQEQAAIREQMKQEAEERKALEQERKKVEKEEQKFKNEIDKIKAQLQEANENETAALNAKILELESKLSDVALKRESIANLQNGKAGNVYIISNLGSFGENVFKIGMTRRLDPIDRVNELGSASVPFKFDVHSFIFSEDAVGLETKLHNILNDKRVNKVNLRKEFFYSNIDELEQLVREIDPTAEFNKTMIAEEFKQSQSTTGIYTSELSEDYFDDKD